MSQDREKKQTDIMMAKFAAKKLKSKMKKEDEELGKTTQSKLIANLHSAANEGKVELVRLLLRCGADANAQDQQFGNTALHQAAWNGFSDTVQVLCKYRANTSIRNKALFTPLHMAAQQGHNQTARLLLMAQAKTEAKNSYGDTPLHTAARYGHAGVARILLSAKCNPNQVNKNHDTPLHIAAAMGRRKLTKIFMQNAAEPAIKNKQNETAMDIALRKDLIDIQEIIANPPPTRTTFSSTNKRDSLVPEVAANLLRADNPHAVVGQQLYISRNPSQQQRRARHRNRRHHAHLSSDDSSELEHRFASQLKLRSSASHAHLPKCHQRRMRGGDHVELAVDVADEASSVSKKLVTKSGFSSLHSLSFVGRAPTTQPEQPNRRTRTRTTIGGASSELRLLSEPKQSPLEEEEEACLAPDAREGAPDWVLRADSGKCPEAPKASSPAGSARSSLSKSHGRLIVRRRKQKSSLLVRRPNLGTCVGKLSLLRLRSIVNRRQAERQQESNEPEEVEAGKEAEEEDENSALESGAKVGGRRQERLEREQLSGQRAINGTQLSATRPLASLADESQLYAIPKKSKPKQQVAESEQMVSNSTTATSNVVTGKSASDELQSVRVPSGGPALTSDGGHSSSAGSSSSFARATPPSSSSNLASSEEESADIVCVKRRSAGNTPLPAVPASDLYSAPGYSVIREAPATSSGKEPEKEAESNEACLCKQQTDDAQANNTLTSTTEADNCRLIKNSLVEQVDQREPQQVKPSKLRQLLHLDSRFKDSRTDSGKAGSAEEPNRVPLSAIAGGYYAYSPVVRSSSDERTTVQQEAPEVAEVEAKVSKKNWLMSKFSLSQPTTTPRTASDKVDPLLAPERKAELIIIGANSLPETSSDADNQAQIRPKSALSATSADLIAAQRSLAAAAAAKVNRDRLVKVNGDVSDKEGVLTVKTSEPFWPGAKGVAKYMIGQPLVAHRGGTNSVGMSDSSPSNNGADSDNSIQTGSSGSANTDTAIQPNETSSPLGILSRILLNNKSSSRRSDSSCVEENKLDQLGSRSRCPIVVSRSNGSDSSATENPINLAPPLPAKNVLKSEVEPMNGLPRVSSYTQMSGFGRSQQLCNYHALGQQQVSSQQYNPYAAYRCADYAHHMSQTDLRSSTLEQLTSNSQLTNNYYLSDLAYSRHPHLSQPARYHYNDMYPLDYPLASHDDSIYIPYLTSGGQHIRRDTSACNSELFGANKVTSFNQLTSNRPKSSLDNFLLSNNNEAPQVQPKMGAYYSYSNRSPFGASAAAYLYSENSIYATDQTAAKFGSNLTVLPTATTSIKNESDNEPKKLSLVDTKQISSIQTPKANVRLQSAEDKNSWTSTPYKSLVHINQTQPNSNQSSHDEHPPFASTSTQLNLQFTSQQANNVNRGHKGQTNTTRVVISNQVAQVNEVNATANANMELSKQNNNNNSSTRSLSPEDFNGSTVL